MIKRDEIKEVNYLKKLSIDVPEFVELEEFDNLIYVDYDRLGTYLIRLLESSSSEEKLIIAKIFNHLNSFFNVQDELILNIIEVCILENLTTVSFGYDVAKIAMNEEMYNYFIEKFPYEEYKDSWNVANYYSDKDYQRILDLPDVEDDETG